MLKNTISILNLTGETTLPTQLCRSGVVRVFEKVPIQGDDIDVTLSVPQAAHYHAGYILATLA